MATNVFAARAHYTVEDPYERTKTPDSRPTFGLDDGEIDRIVLSASTPEHVEYGFGDVGGSGVGSLDRALDVLLFFRAVATTREGATARARDSRVDGE
ncbi:hypothetical protein C446_17419, partial [Halobiforma nitratireducens JCM 10879]